MLHGPKRTNGFCGLPINQGDPDHLSRLLTSRAKRTHAYWQQFLCKPVEPLTACA